MLVLCRRYWFVQRNLSLGLRQRTSCTLSRCICGRTVINKAQLPVFIYLRPYRFNGGFWNLYRRVVNGGQYGDQRPMLEAGPGIDVRVVELVTF